MRFLPYCPRVLLLAVTLLTGKLAAQTVAGTLDTTYGTAGVGVVSATGGTFTGTTVEVQADGGTLLAGQISEGSSSPRMAVARLLPSGQLDTDFGVSGFFTFSESTAAYTVRALAVQADGQIIVAGDAGNTFYVLRLTATGMRDYSFALTRLTHTTAAQCTDVVVLKDGRIAVSGHHVRMGHLDRDGVIYRLASTGNLDTSYGIAGRYLFSTSDEQNITCLLVQEDGKLVHAGRSRTGTSYVGRLTTAGVEDTTFEGFGRTSLFSHATHPGAVQALVQQPDGKIMILVPYPANGPQAALRRVTADGASDREFSDDGTYLLAVGGPTWEPADVLVQSDGRIVIASHQPGAPGTSQIRLRRLERNGDEDSTFGTSGAVTFTHGSGGNLALGLRELPGGDLLLGSTTVVSPTPQVSLAALRVQRGPAASIPTFSITRGPQPQTVSVGAEVTLTGEIITDQPEKRLGYAWYRGSTLVKVTREPSFTLSQVQGTDEGNYTMEVFTPGLRVRSQPAQLTVLQPPVIAQMPAEVTFIPFLQSRSLSFRMQGRLPATYQLIRDEVPQTERPFNSPESLNLPFYSGLSQGTQTYRIRFSNADGFALSAPFRIITVTDPFIAPGDDVLLVAGQPLNLQPLIYTLYDYASNEARITWKLNRKTLPVPPSQTTYARNPSRLADAGTYQVSIKHNKGSAQRDFRIGIVDIRPRTHIAATGRKFELSIPTAGPGLTYSWTHQGEPLQARADLTGVDGPKLTFRSLTPADAGAYVCTVKMGALEHVVGAQTVVLGTQVPTLATFTLPVGQIGVPYTTSLPLPAMADRLVIKGLPPGFTYDAIGHSLTGTPLTSGRHTLTVTAISPLGTSAPVKVLLEIPTLAPGISGRFFGVLSGPFPTQMDVTITPDGLFTGKLNLVRHLGGLTQVALKGRLENGLTIGASSSQYHATLPLQIRGFHPTTPSELTFIITEPGALETSLQIPYLDGEGEGSHTLQGYPTHCPYTARSPLSPAYTGIFNLGFLSNTRPDLAPGGSGYARATVTSAGLIHQVGKLADGTALTASAPVNANHVLIGLQSLYSHRGSITYEYTLQPGNQAPDYVNARLSGHFDWVKTAPVNAKHTHYPTAFNTTCTLENGGKYLSPKHKSGLTGPLMFNAKPDQPYLEIAIRNTYTYGTLTTSHGLILEKSLKDNPLGVKSLKFSPATGLFTGSGVTRVEEEIYDPKTETFHTRTVIRAYTLQGLITRPHDSLTGRGFGFTLWPELYDLEGNEKRFRLQTSYPVTLTPD